MPHFVIDCSASVLDESSENEINQLVHNAALQTELFSEHEIKVRVNPYSTYMVGGQATPFIHVFSSIMQGRTVEQRAGLSKAVVAALSQRFSDVEFIAMNVDEFEKATYCNRGMLV